MRVSSLQVRHEHQQMIEHRYCLNINQLVHENYYRACFLALKTLNVSVDGEHTQNYISLIYLVDLIGTVTAIAIAIAVEDDVILVYLFHLKLQ